MSPWPGSTMFQTPHPLVDETSADGGASPMPPPTTSADREFRTARAETLWRTTRTLAGVVLLATVLGAWFLREAARPLAILTWSLTVTTALLLLCRERRAAATLNDRALHRAEGWTAAQTAAVAMLWLSLPASAFIGQPAPVQAVIGGLVCLMMASGVLLVVLPIAAAWWSGMLGLALIGMLLADGGRGSLPYVTLVLAYLAALFTGARHAGRLVRDHVALSGETQGRCDAVELLLAQYEQQGVGWLWQTDTNHQLTYASSRISSLLGVTRGKIIGHSLPLVLGCDPKLGEALVARVAFDALEVEVATPAGNRWIALSASPIIDADRRFHGFRGVGSDVTESRASRAHLTRLAASDVLTGLPNRQKMRELIGDALAQAAGSGRTCALLFADLDAFKPVNDSFGHNRGDIVLREVARRFVDAVGSAGVVGRLGGDEFAVIIPHAESRSTVGTVSERLIQSVGDPFEVDGMTIRVGVTIGCAFGPLDATGVDDLVQRADLALYDGKAHKRGSFRFFDADLQRAADERKRLESDLREAVAKEQFVLHYQPLVTADSREVTGFEALIRWPHPIRGMVPPLQFIPLAEEIGLIGAIGDWVIRTATRDAATWPDHIRVAVNVSACQLQSDSLPNVVAEALKRARMPANRLEIEVTESVFMGDSDDVLDVLARIRALGCAIALDDFGTGYSSLGYLNRAIFHKLKIDGSFVREAARRQETVAIISAIVAIARSFRMTITAEGIERAEDFTRMRDLGCHQMQGYLFGKPMPADKAAELVGMRWSNARTAAG